MQEDSQTEFKSSFSDAVIESLVAFANTKGGKVLIGVDDKGVPVKGFSVGNESVQKWVNEIKNKTQPSIIPDVELINFNGTDVGELSIKEFPIKPVSFKGRYYKRVKNSNHQLSIHEISELHLKAINSSWDSYLSPKYKLSDISLDKVQEFIDICNRDRAVIIEDAPVNALTKLELIDPNGGISNACFLLFSRREVFAATIELGRFSTPISIKDGLTVRSDLFTEVEEVLNFIRKHINKEYIITGNPQREERWQYPMQSLREIVINMVVHRNYMNPDASLIKIYNERIEFWNPGTLPDGISIDQLINGNYVSRIRNVKIASTFKEAQLIERYGSGIKRIQQGFIVYGLKPPFFEEFQGGFRVTVYSGEESFDSERLGKRLGEKLGEKLGERLGEKLTKIHLSIIQAMRKNNKISQNELAKTIGISNTAIQNNTRYLQEKGFIKRMGPARGGHWQIL